jgi:outer membrane protein assembly factor BamB
VLSTLSALSTIASPKGWIDDGVNETRGNNVDAFLDADNNQLPDRARPQGFPWRGFDTGIPIDLSQSPATTANQDAAIINAFYWCNWMHDKLYEFGFTEAAGNFQKNNFGRGGSPGDDSVRVLVQNSSASSPPSYYHDQFLASGPDGTPVRIFLSLANGTNRFRDSGFDAEVILHEYTHGLLSRLIGWGSEPLQLQEGWCDFYAWALLSQSGDDLAGRYAFGAYSRRGYNPFGIPLTQNYYFGLRLYPYSTDITKNPLTFQDMATGSANLPPSSEVPRNPAMDSTSHYGTIPGSGSVHFWGETWAVTLWEARANLINKWGCETGNRMIVQLVTDGIRMTPPDSPVLVARDMILLADRVNTSGQNLNELWAAFAKRGMGYSATENWPTLVEGYDLPPRGGQVWPSPYTIPGALMLASPAVAPDGTIYVGATDGKLHAVKPDGTAQPGFPFVPIGTLYSFNSSPAIGADGTIYVGRHDGRVYAINPNGTQKWSYLTGGSVRSSPAIGPDESIYFGSYDNKVYALDPNTGLVKSGWPIATTSAFRSSPAISPDGAIYIGCNDGKLYAFLPSGATKSGWPHATGAAIYGSPAVGADGTIYVGSTDGKLYAFNPDGSYKGGPFNAGASVQSSPAIGPEGNVYFGADSGAVYALSSGRALLQTWSFVLIVDSSLAVASDGTVVIGTWNQRVYGLKVGQANPVWEFAAGNAVQSSPALATSSFAGNNGVVYIGANNGNLYALSNVVQLATSPWPMFRRNARHTAYDWSSLGSSPAGGGIEAGKRVYAVAASGTTLYAGGDFTTAGGSAASGVAKWNGTSWSALGSGLSSGYVAGCGLSGGSLLFIGGEFATAGGMQGPNIGKWYATAWQTLYGTDGPVFAVTVAANGDVYLGGLFNTAYGMTMNNVFRINSTGGYQALAGMSGGAGVNGPVYAVTVNSSGQVYVGGSFTSAAGSQISPNIARWAQGSGWSSVGNGADQPVAALAMASNGVDVFVGGYFANVYHGGVTTPSRGAAKWQPGSGTWAALGSALNGDVFTIAVDGSKVFFGGDFTIAGGTAANDIALWDGAKRLPVGGGANSIVEALAIASDYIYAGGHFSSAGDTPANGVARWKR